MNIIDNFFNEIEKVLFVEASKNDWELFNDLEDYFIDNNETIFKKKKKKKGYLTWVMKCKM